MIKIKHENKTKEIWIPKSLIGNKSTWRKTGILELPCWKWDQILKELD